MTETKPGSGRWWRIAVAAFVLVLVALAGAAVVFLSLAADVVRDEVVLRHRGQVAPASVLEINRSERKKNLPAQVVLAYVGPEPIGWGKSEGCRMVSRSARWPPFLAPVLYDPEDPSRARIATLGWPVMDFLLLLLGVGVSALLPIAMLRVWLPRDPAVDALPKK